MRFGDSKQMTGICKVLALFRSVRMSFSFFGRKPTKRYSVQSMDEAEISVAGADAPGIGIMLMSASLSSDMATAPGSDMFGVPASLTMAIDFPSFTNSIIFSAPLRSLNLFNFRVGVLMLKWERRFLVTRVSSQATKSTCLSVSINLSDESERFPIGVAQT